MADLRKVYTYSVLIDGIEANGLTLAGASINYGSTGEARKVEPTDARLTLISRDAAPEIADQYPGIGLGDHSKPSGFTDDYRDKYEGAFTQLVPGASVEVIARPVLTGFDDAYLDEYVGAGESTRFVGHIGAIDYTPAYVGLTCVDRLGPLNRIEIGAGNWPQENETARATRIETESGIDYSIVGTSTATLAARTGQTVKALEALAELARDCDALLWANRLGQITYRTRTSDTGSVVYHLPPNAVLVDSLSMSNEIGRVYNSVVVEYGNPKANVTVENAASVAKYGERDTRFTTGLATAGDATTYGNRYLAGHAETYWRMPSVTVDLAIADYNDIPDLLDIDLDDEVVVPTAALRGAPVEEYQARVVGYTETLDPYAWRITYSLSPQGWTRKANV